jgi:hypothetical protein
MAGIEKRRLSIVPVSVHVHIRVYLYITMLLLHYQVIYTTVIHPKTLEKVQPDARYFQSICP